MISSGRDWGIEPDERGLEFPCDRYMERFDDAYYRGISIDAPPETVFKWLCQMRVAPYSYDWIDNLGRRSPQHLIPGLDRPEIGETILVMFDLVEFAPGSHFTMRTKRANFWVGLLGTSAVSYMIVPKREGRCRLLVKLLVRYPEGLHGKILRRLLPWGDLIMMRRQLLNFKRLSERTPAGPRERENR